MPVGTTRTSGIIEETKIGYRFSYDEEYLNKKVRWPISKTLPIFKHPYSSSTMFPFFDDLIQEGWM
ncbi:MULTISPECIES: HipA N-terminal domain-containing protein [unclassified Saccharicrinis]|uniref:HipA N-terminal domain-containing protein n=1 Tax=unclassified Saccharicrinis TaxID=2646859 RepID=UPI003D35137E